MSENLGRPILVTIAGGLMALFGFIALVLGLLILMKDSLGTDFSNMIADLLKAIKLDGSVAGSVYLIYGIILFVIGYGFLRGWSLFWFIGVAAWVLGLIFFGYTLAQSLGGGFVASQAIPFIICLIMVIYLFTPKVRGHFLS